MRRQMLTTMFNNTCNSPSLFRYPPEVLHSAQSVSWFHQLCSAVWILFCLLPLYTIIILLYLNLQPANLKPCLLSWYCEIQFTHLISVEFWLKYHLGTVETLLVCLYACFTPTFCSIFIMLWTKLNPDWALYMRFHWLLTVLYMVNCLNIKWYYKLKIRPFLDS